MRVQAQQYDTVDALCWRNYGRTEGVTEAVYQANPRLAELGPVLPAGYWLELPDTIEPAQQNIIQLWD
ncbi:TPA: tail protein X [Yersinia enterocolitica]|uniref:tail protein X n=1 Tax=Yersinia enterocolitica TaxID=630 RepID=UPI001F5873A8|nr:tail protein X [Yersinia enterocolitica]HDL6766492.1 tail protein X [Yersinia enterocolitica]HDW2133964.1 tail protein X [Yersinia enterocolitica]